MSGVKKTKTKTKTASKSVLKKISVAFEKEYYDELFAYASKNGMSVEEYAKNAIHEKFDSDRISNMIDYMSR